MGSNSDCLFCEDGNPCVTHSSKPKVRSAKAVSISPVIAIAPVESESDDTDADWFGGEKQVNHFAEHITEFQMSPDELSEREAIRNLWPILSASERNRHIDLVNIKLTPRQMKESAAVRRFLDANVQRKQQFTIQETSPD